MAPIDDVIFGVSAVWILYNTSLIVFLQAGLALWEVGSVRKANADGVLYKNLFNGAITVIAWWILGYGFAYGNTKGGFIGVQYFGLDGEKFDNSYGFLQFFNAWAYAAVAVTIASGAVAERTKKVAYLVSAAAVGIWIFPIIVHWCWGQGWLSPHADQRRGYLFYGQDSNNYIDAAGSGVVLTVGGVAGLVGAIAVGPRKGRFEGGNFKKSSVTTAVLGALILWFTWYGFNFGQIFSVNGRGGFLAGKVAAVTTLSLGFSTATTLLVQLITGNWDHHQLASSLVAGLVGISAGCTVVEMWGAMLIGIGSSLFYLIASHALVAAKIDDAIEAFPIFGAAGIWGALAVGIFGSDHNAAFAGYKGSLSGSHPLRTGEQFGVQLVAIICIVAWTFGWAALVWFGLKATVGVRDEEEKEETKEIELSSA